MTWRVGFAFAAAFGLAALLVASAVQRDEVTSERRGEEPRVSRPSDVPSARMVAALERRIAMLESRPIGSGPTPVTVAEVSDKVATEPDTLVRPSMEDALRRSYEKMDAFDAMMGMDDQRNESREISIDQEIDVILQQFDGVDAESAICTSSACRIPISFEDASRRNHVLSELMDQPQWAFGGFAHFEPINADGSSTFIAYVLAQGQAPPDVIYTGNGVQ